MKSLVIAAVAALIASGVTAEPIKLRADWSATPAQTPPLMPAALKHAPNLYTHWGKSYVVEPIFVAGGGQNLTNLAANEVEMSALTPVSLAVGTTEAKLDLRVIAQQMSDFIPGYGHSGFWVRDDIKRVEDLKGKIVGINARASSPEVAAKIMMARAGLQDGRDYQLVEVRLPAQLATLEAKKTDAAMLILPFTFMAEKKGFKELFAVGDALGPAETVDFVVRADFLAKNRATLVDFLEDNFRLRRWLYDPKTRPDAIKLVAEVTKLPEAAFADWVYTKRDYYIDPNGLLDEARLQKNIDDLHANGVLKTTVKVAPLVDMSLAKEAAARLAKGG